jgi:lipid II:glycine glycyltransferase (peptidoglycan interpeptide bridge formation enzyme)
MGGLMSTTPLTAADVSAVVADLRSLGHLRVSIRPNPLLGDVWAEGVPADVHASPRFAHSVDLRPGFDHLWEKAFAKAVRKGVRKAERNGVEIEVDSTDRLLPVYYELFEDSIRRWAEQQREPLRMAQYRAHHRDPFSKIEAIVKGMGAKSRVWIARHDGQPASALITIQDGRSITGVKAAMNKEIAGPMHTNDLIYTRVIERACEEGLEWYHLGESGSNPQLAAFKRRFGAEGHDYAEYFIERIPLSPADAKLRALVKRAIKFKDF